MTSPNEEHISGLVDGELQPRECRDTIDRLLKDPAACACWERYHLISDALKRNLPSALNRDFAADVMAALKQEPTVLAPPRRNHHSLTRRLAGLAVAASVATIGILGVQNLYQEDGMVPAPAQLAQSPLPQSAMPAATVSGQAGIRQGIQLVQQGTIVQEPDTQGARHLPPNLNRYLVDHSQQTARSVQGMIPYARIVTYPTVESDNSWAQK